MRLIGYGENDDVFIGYMNGDEVVRIADRATFWRNPERCIAAGGSVRSPRAELTLCSALPLGAKIICIGLNYRAHAIETGAPIPEKPVVFSRWADTVIVSGDASPAMDEAYDWEAELGVAIGRRTLAVTPKEASEGILGYCTFNDLSARTLQMETSQWTLGKNSDRSGPMGPIVTVNEAGNPAEGWRVTAHVNGDLMQDGNTSDMIFDVPTLIAHVSRAMTLQPGDLIITGTPPGVGAALKPQRFLKPGDVVRVEVGKLGAVTTPIIARPWVCG
ncbi:fumarylacetoacetate hydrolase family protein [Bradyrhizobium sp. INPA03-11B]|uniref:fumarylacetoacetate hydrolase family protein n=1 Tax=Bradyrhizobium sp. INPA03-11B TaxID=418598 RepID=UPI00338D8C3F